MEVSRNPPPSPPLLVHTCHYGSSGRGCLIPGCVSDHSGSNRTDIPSDAASAVTQLTWCGPLSIISIWEDFSIEGQMSPLNVLSRIPALDINLSDAADVCSTNRKAISPAVRED